MVLLVAVSALVAAVSIALALRLPFRGAVERSVTALLIAHATVTGLLLVAGVVVRRLEPAVVAGLAVVFAVSVVGWLWRDRPAARAAMAEGRRSVLAGLANLDAVLRWWPAGVLAALVVAALAWRAVIALQLPVLDYDGFSYHLVTVDVWLQTGEVGRVPQRWWSDGYPANGELLTLWLMLFTGSDRLATFTGFAGVPLAFVATVGLARVLGAGRAAAILAALVLVAMPAFLALTPTTYVDGLVIAYLAAAWYLGLAALAADGPRRSALLALAGIAIGLGVGTKATLLLPLGVLALGLIVDAVRRAPRPAAIRAGLATAVIIGIGAAAFGGYWYVKNVVVFGNPFWPFTFAGLPGIGTFDQLIVQTPAELAGLPSLARIARNWFADPGLRSYVYDTRLGGFGIGWPLLLVLGVAGGAILARLGRFIPLLLLALPAVVTLVVMPMSWWARLTLFIPLLVAGLAAVALSRLPRRAGFAASVALVLAATASIAVATLRGNARIETGSSLPPLPRMVTLVTASAAERRNVGFWRDCATLATIPAGSRVAWDDFNLLHAIAGHRFDRYALEPIVPTSDPLDLMRQALRLRADYFLLHDAGISLVAAKGDPARFRVVGPGCLRTQIVEVVGA